MPNFEGAVNPLERRGPTVIQLLLQELSGPRASKNSGLSAKSLMKGLPRGRPSIPRNEEEKIGWDSVYAPDGSARSYFPLESVAGSLPESLAVRHLVPLLPWLCPRSAHHHLCVIHK
jgi:hypothetical protein